MGAFCATGKSELVILDANVNGAEYRRILEQHLLPWSRGLFSDNSRYQDDRTQNTTFLEEQELNVLGQPALSPDLNPAEHV